MFCAISPEDYKTFQYNLYTSLLQKNEPIINLKSFTKDLYNKLIENSKDEEGNVDQAWAAAYIAAMPKFLLEVYGDADMRIL